MIAELISITSMKVQTFLVAYSTSALPGGNLQDSKMPRITVKAAPPGRSSNKAENRGPKLSTLLIDDVALFFRSDQ